MGIYADKNKEKKGQPFGGNFSQTQPVQKKGNNTGLPDHLKDNVENMSGYSMDDVKVHFNSSKPETLQAHAYAQGTDIHLGPGQEKHLPHEAWHVVQQKQGRVQPTMQLKGVDINNQEGLETEADVMGERALQLQVKPSVLSFKDGHKSHIIQREIADEEINRHLREMDRRRDFDIGVFLGWQKRIDRIKPGYRTMGPEFEFAKLNVEAIPIHVELAKSTTTINGLPVVLETDAGNVVELACPPFVIATSMDDWDVVQERSMLITNKFEQTLKGIAEQGVGSGMMLRGLIQAVVNLFNTPFSLTPVEADYQNTTLASFSKGIAAFSNATFDKSMVSNAQINLKMTTDEVGKALRSGWKGDSAHMYLKNLVNLQLLNALQLFKKDMTEGKYRDRVAIISYYLSQIPVMSLQYIMNQVRSDEKEKTGESKEENRSNFRVSHKNNQQLLIRLSSIKDYMGFWIKASLNDMMKDDPTIKAMILGIDGESLKGFALANSKYLGRFKTGLETYTGSDLTEYYNNAVGSIVDNLFTLARTEGIQQPQKIGFPRHKDEGESSDLIDYAHGAPFMARQDTYVPLEGGHLVEVRGLNKKIFSNKYMRGFQMPFYRKFGERADETSDDYYKKELKRKRDD